MLLSSPESNDVPTLLCLTSLTHASCQSACWKPQEGFRVQLLFKAPEATSKTMATFMNISLLLLFLQVFACTSIHESRAERGVNKSSSLDHDDIQGLNVVLLTLPESGNLAPILALSEELVRRGHSVTLITTTRNEGNFSSRTIEQAERVDVTYKSAGNTLFLISEIAKKSLKDVWTILSTFTSVMPQEQGTIMSLILLMSTSRKTRWILSCLMNSFNQSWHALTALTKYLSLPLEQVYSIKCIHTPVGHGREY